MASQHFLQMSNFELISFVTVVAVCLLLPIRFIRELWICLISSTLNVRPHTSIDIIWLLTTIGLLTMAISNLLHRRQNDDTWMQLRMA